MKFINKYSEKAGKLLNYSDLSPTNLESLIGENIFQIFISPGERQLLLITNSKYFFLQAEGDCCSESWFADLLGVDALLNSKIFDIEELPLKDYNLNDGRGRQDYDQVYGYKFKTSKGYADLIFRNSSNGYYGGWLTTRFIERKEYNPSIVDVDIQELHPNLANLENCREIKQDWHA
jgi:hypothetical protein